MKLTPLLLILLIVSAPIQAASPRKNAVAAAGVSIGIVGLTLLVMYAYTYMTNKKMSKETALNTLVGKISFDDFIFFANNLLVEQPQFSEEIKPKLSAHWYLARKKMSPEDNAMLDKAFAYFDEINKKIKTEIDRHKKEYTRNMPAKVRKVLALNDRLIAYCKNNNLDKDAKQLPPKGEALRRELCLCLLTRPKDMTAPTKK